MVSIYSPKVKREAELLGITELQAYRNLNAREAILRNLDRGYGRPVRFEIVGYSE